MNIVQPCTQLEKYKTLPGINQQVIFLKIDKSTHTKSEKHKNYAIEGNGRNL